MANNDYLKEADRLLEAAANAHKALTSLMATAAADPLAVPANRAWVRELQAAIAEAATVSGELQSCKGDDEALTEALTAMGQFLADAVKHCDHLVTGSWPTWEKTITEVQGRLVVAGQRAERAVEALLNIDRDISQSGGSQTDNKNGEGTAMAMNSDYGRRKLTEFVRSNRLAFQGSEGEAVRQLEKLADKLSVADFAAELAERKAMHERMSLAGMRPQGLANYTGEAAVLIERLVRGGMSEGAAASKIFSERPDLYKEYNRQQQRRQSGG